MNSAFVSVDCHFHSERKWQAVAGKTAIASINNYDVSLLKCDVGTASLALIPVIHLSLFSQKLRGDNQLKQLS